MRIYEKKNENEMKKHISSTGKVILLNTCGL